MVQSFAVSLRPEPRGFNYVTRFSKGRLRGYHPREDHIQSIIEEIRNNEEDTSQDNGETSK